MMVVRIEIWPDGDESDCFEIGRMEVSNISGLAEVSDYHAHIVQRATFSLNVNALEKTVLVQGHPRRNGAWALVRRVLESL